ncbi:uncharacterized protein LOC106640224 [Copidosoma floridanum]|uniref:uncharacterized protein LOC106640224 n=1 Tax=Copidosoma floridanum TaxID=29053 RepID=UPI0006C986A6|nr:uncharacterized protein LOC106640224 [Copidosoma floridanum]
MESKQNGNNYQENKRFLSRLHNSKEEFHKQYEKFYGDKVKAKQLYLQLLSELRKAIIGDNVDNFERLISFLSYITDSESRENLISFYYNEANVLNVSKSTNLLIFISKHNSFNIMKYVLNNVTILRNFTLNCKTEYVPDDVDEAGHTAFYYALRSNNIELTDILIHKWPGNYFVCNLDKLDTILSKAYEELRLKNVVLTKEMELYVEDKLVHLRFNSDTSKCDNISSKVISLSKIKERIVLVLESIRLLKEIPQVDDRFLFVAKFIAQNISVLKQQLKSTYDSLPWEEMEFCLISFVSSYIKRQEVNLFYRVVLSRSRILKHLTSFEKKLDELKKSLENYRVEDLAVLPEVNRDKIVAKITKDNPKLSELYNDYHDIRDIHSLQKISNYVQLATIADPKERQGQLAIIRSLQLIGEYLKNTLESPKLSNFTSELLLLSLPNNTRKIFINLRNSPSHVYALTKRLEIKDNEDMEYFITIQKDIQKTCSIITYILYKSKIKAIKVLLRKIVASDSLDDLKEIAHLFRAFELDTVDFRNLNVMEHDILDKLIKELKENVIEKSSLETQMLKKMQEIMSFEKKTLDKSQKDYLLDARMINVLYSDMLDKNTDDYDIKLTKHSAEMTLESMKSKIESHCLKQLAELAAEIARTNKLKTKCENLVEINRLACEIIYVAKFEGETNDWIDDLQGKLNNSSFIDDSRQPCNDCSLSEDDKSKQLASKLVELKNILNISLINNELQFPMSKGGEKLLAVLEMLILDILSILGSSKGLENNLLFVDENAPTLIGKCLRNHLAHDNTLVDVLLSDPSITMFLNAKKLIAEDTIESSKKIGKFVADDPVKVKVRFNQALNVVDSQEKMFAALEHGDLEAVKSCIARGAEINGKNVDSWTALHFAAKSPNIEVMRFVLESNTDVNVKNRSGQSPLHIASMSGNKHIVQLLIKEKRLYANEKDNDGRTPLHYAAKNGHKDVLEMLLKYKVQQSVIDKNGFSALHYGIRNGHKEAVMMLMNKEMNVDENKAYSGYSLLHLAADKGQVDLVNYFLKLKANICAISERGTTPLHLASLRGFLEIVKILITKGSNVNAKCKDGATPLHLAVEFGFKDIAELLIKNGADPNASYNNCLYTPLHYAAKEGRADLVDMLLKKGAKPMAMSSSNLTPLHLAVRSGHLQTVDVFFRHGINVASNPLLHVAIEFGFKDLSYYLIEHNADVHAQIMNVGPLYVAAAVGQIEIVELLLAKGVEIDVKDTEGFTPLLAAVDKGHKDIVELLLKNGADLHARTNTSATTLHIAATNGDAEMVDLLIKKKANVNATDSKKMKPLHLAAQLGYVSITDSLINNAAEINARDSSGMTAVQMAAESGYKKVVEILIGNEVLINTKNKHGCTTLSSAVKNSDPEIVEMLINSGADVNAENGQPILYAVLSGFADIVEVLVRNKALVNLKYMDQNSLLHLSVARNYRKVTEALLASGVDVNATNRSNVTPLSVAISMGSVNIVAILLAHGADIYATIKEGLTPLHIASCEGNVDVLEILLRHGVDANIKDDESRTPLEMAIAYGSSKVAKILFHHTKVNINSQGVNDFSLLHIAAQEGNSEITKYFINNGANVHARDVFDSKPIHEAAKRGHVEVVKIYVDYGLPVDDFGRNNQTPLHYACLGGHSNVARYLLERGADVNAKDCNETTPLHLASISGYKEFIEVLLEYGAFYNVVDALGRKPIEITENDDVINLFHTTERLFKSVKQNNCAEVQQCIKAKAFVNARSVDNVTPLHHASWKGYDEIVNILLQNGANPNVVGKQGLTPLHYAAKFSHPKVLKALLANGAVYNAISETGKTPLDLANDKNVVHLLRLINESFESVIGCDAKVVNEIRKLKDVESVKAVMGTVNTANKSLIMLALHSGFPKVHQLKQIMQDDLSEHIEMAEMFIHQEKYEEALKIFERVLKKRTEILGASNPDTLDIQSRIAKLLYKQQKYPEALVLLEEIYGRQNAMLGSSIKDTLGTKSTIALIMHRQGKSEEAFKLYEEIYMKQRETAGVPDNDILNTRFHMAVVLEGLGKYDEAMAIFNEVLEKQKKSMGMRDPETITTLNNIAALLERTGNSDEALKVYRKVYEVRKIILGPTHSDTLKTLFHINSVLVHQGKFREALEAYEDLLDTQRNVFGPKHIITLNTWHNIAQTYMYSGKYVSALKILTSCLGPRKVILGAEHSDILRTEQIIEQIQLSLKLEGVQNNIMQSFESEMKMAIERGDVKFMEYLFKHMVDVNEQDPDGRTLLHFAVNLGHEDVVSMLLKSGAIVTKATNKGNTPLHTGTSRGYKNIVEILLKQVNRDKLNDFINARTSVNGMTALHVAARCDDYDIIKILLKHGAVYDIRNNEDKRPVDLAKEPEALRLLQSIDELFQRAKQGDDKLVESLKTVEPEEFKAMTNTRDHQDKSIFQVALVNKHPQLAGKLLKLLKTQNSN